MLAVKIAISVMAAYLLGSVPFGYLIGRLYGIDIRQHGSGNIGATNVWRTLGRAPGLAAFVLDTGKGAAAVLLARSMALPPVAELVCALAVLVGHSWPVFLGFKGGKMIATGLGVVLALAPLPALSALGVWLVCVLAARIVSLASILAACSLPLWMYVWHYSEGYLIFAVVVAVLAVLRHRENIRRLLAGTEPRIKW